MDQAISSENTKSQARGLIWIWLSLLVFASDQMTKYWVVQHLTLFESKSILPFFDLTLLYNKGSAFGFLSQVGWPAEWLFVGIAIVVSILLIYWLYRLRDNHWASAAVALILGGALGNLANRLMFGYVIDFLDFYIKTWHWPPFNVADSAIVIGAFMLVIKTGLSQKRET